MTYDPDRSVYRGTLFLKQGYYNYTYVLKDYNHTRLWSDRTEGDHSETENDYQVFVYLRTPVSDFDQLVGYTILNSVRKTEETISNSDLNNNIKKTLEEIMK